MFKHQWWRNALLARCPSCGEGGLFSKWLDFAPTCSHCGASFADQDAGDGPTVFVILIVGAILVPLAMFLVLGLKLNVVLALAIITPICLGLCLYLLRVFKAGLYILQRLHKAGEGTLLAKPATGPKATKATDIQDAP